MVKNNSIMKRIFMALVALAGAAAIFSCGPKYVAPVAEPGSEIDYSMSFIKSVVAVEDKDMNLAVSPYSAGVALSMLAEGAEGQTKAEFNKALNEHKLRDCEDSTSSLTSKRIQFTSGNDTEFTIDVCITCRDEKDNYHRLIHDKKSWVLNGRYFWNMAPHSKKLKEKADHIKKCGKWELVREQYRRIKNRYLSENDHDHPSFVCYVEAVSNVYNSRNHW